MENPASGLLLAGGGLRYGDPVGEFRAFGPLNEAFTSYALLHPTGPGKEGGIALCPPGPYRRPLPG